MKDPLFGRYCSIPYGYYERPFVFRILASGVRSNTWCEVPLRKEEKVSHGAQSEDILFVVLDTLVSDQSRIIRVRQKDVTLISDEDYPQKRWGE